MSTGQRQKMGNEALAGFPVDGEYVTIVGCWDEGTPEGKYDYYDLFVDGECINLGEPCYEYPTEQTIRAHLEIRRLMKQE